MSIVGNQSFVHKHIKSLSEKEKELCLEVLIHLYVLRPTSDRNELKKTK